MLTTVNVQFENFLKIGNKAKLIGEWAYPLANACWISAFELRSIVIGVNYKIAETDNAYYDLLVMEYNGESLSIPLPLVDNITVGEFFKKKPESIEKEYNEKRFTGDDKHFRDLVGEFLFSSLDLKEITREGVHIYSFSWTHLNHLTNYTDEFIQSLPERPLDLGFSYIRKVTPLTYRFKPRGLTFCTDIVLSGISGFEDVVAIAA